MRLKINFIFRYTKDRKNNIIFIVYCNKTK